MEYNWLAYAPTCDLDSANNYRDHRQYRCLRVRQSTCLWNVATIASVVRTEFTLAKWGDFFAGSLTIPENSGESLAFAYDYLDGSRASVGSLVVLVSSPPDSAGFLMIDLSALIPLFRSCCLKRLACLKLTPPRVTVYFKVHCSER
jgi:hypothetical protein